jgi:hypothetical protein
MQKQPSQIGQAWQPTSPPQQNIHCHKIGNHAPHKHILAKFTHPICAHMGHIQAHSGAKQSAMHVWSWLRGSPTHTHTHTHTKSVNLEHLCTSNPTRCMLRFLHRAHFWIALPGLPWNLERQRGIMSQRPEMGRESKKMPFRGIFFCTPLCGHVPLGAPEQASMLAAQQPHALHPHTLYVPLHKALPWMHASFMMHRRIASGRPASH